MTSDSVRFSVEVLPSYAPRFDEAGAALSQVAAMARHRLEGLGAFWGSSWPDKAFADAYRSAQRMIEQDRFLETLSEQNSNGYVRPNGTVGRT